MDLNRKGSLVSYEGGLAKNDTFGDTTLRLNCLGYGGSGATARYGCIQSNLGGDFSNSATDDSCRLVLGLGPTPSAYSDNYYNVGFQKNKVFYPRTRYRDIILSGFDRRILFCWSGI
ncbi:hypothetical protein CJ030_MR7G008144 [Morella rubra]|uniref:Uncharacterized protein n=1 Tax=Morella rubra TaxID=262757 RepID=A0A6A1V6Y4_9ROSI|nr:hypothetical protein CJ030_MR7G008144 [Morella rubra]